MKQLPETIAADEGFTVVGAGAELLRELLRELEREMKSQSAPVEQFQPGIPGAQVRERLEAVGRGATDEVVVWFEWHNGIAVNRHSRLLPRFELWSLDDVITGIREPVAPYGTEDWEWNPGWVQLTGDNNGLIYRWDRDPAAPSLIRAMGPIPTATGNTEHQAVSLCTPVTWWIESLRSGSLQWDMGRDRWDNSRYSEQPPERLITLLV